MDTTTIYSTVHARYTASALSPSSPSHSNAVAQAFGYSPEDLSSIPSDSNLGLSCGNPLALASLKPGETVLDLGCGAGFDCFLAAKKVGKHGCVIGIDMNEHMLSKARLNASKIKPALPIEFVNSRITSVPLPPSTADVVISNCVINLVPHESKHVVFEETFRLLKPGGRVAVSDILAKKPLTAQMKKDVALYVGCVAGASTKEEYEGWLKSAGFEEAAVVDAGGDLNVYTRGGEQDTCGESGGEKEACCGAGSGQEVDGGVAQDMKINFEHVDLNEWAGSYKIYAVKAA